MAKYIDKMALPQFQYYNFCEGDEYGWSGTTSDDMNIYYTTPDGKRNTLEYIFDDFDPNEAMEDYDRLVTTPDTEAQGLIDELKEKWVETYNDLDNRKDTAAGKIYMMINYALKAMFDNESLEEEWLERMEKFLQTENKGRYEMERLLATIAEYATFTQLLRTAQGFPLQITTDSQQFPKMVLIEDKLYKKTRGSKNISLDYRYLKRVMGDETYVVTINGESAEKKMIFVLINHDNCISVNMLDPKNGASNYIIGTAADSGKFFPDAMADWNIANREHPINSDDTFIMKSTFRCHPRGDYECTRKENSQSEYCIYCNGEHNCVYKMMDIISTVAYLFQEYMRKVENEEKITPSVKEGSRAAAKTRVESYIPEGMMRMYDVNVSEDLQRVDKFRLFSKKSSQYPSTEKCAHVRRSTMRYNPKTGQKDIKVRGSIIHKDKYKGFSSAERIVE